MKTQNTLPHYEKTAYDALESKAAEIERLLQELVVLSVSSAIPDNAKVNILSWISRADTFRGLSYMLHPQTEWLGGENFTVRAPHISKP